MSDVHPSKAVLASHALGAVPDDGERQGVEAHLDDCVECRVQLREFKLAAAELVGEGETVVLEEASLERAWARVRRRIGR